MGHERVGALPRSRIWRNIVSEIAEFSIENDNIQDISKNTLRNVRTQFDSIPYDTGLQSAFKFFVLLSFASNQENPLKFLKNQNIDLPSEISPLKLSKKLSDWVNKNNQSLEYSTFAIKAGIDTIADWYERNSVQQTKLFKTQDNSLEIWEKASTGAGFCELSRMFFSNFTNRYLKYFLEREASSVINSISTRNEFNNHLEKHLKEISIHAFETSKITQSFAAGWFNKNAINNFPSDNKISDFLKKAFGKLRDELIREEAK